MKIVNGKLGSFRQVVIKPSGNVAPVLLAKWTGQVYQQYTIQQATVGDRVLRIVWDGCWTGAQVVQQDGTLGELNRDVSLLDSLPWDLRMWITTKPDHTMDNMLPPGLGWNGVDTVYSRHKETIIRNTLKGLPFEVINRIVAKAVQSPMHGLPGWVDALPMPAQLHNSTQIWDGKMFRINTAQIWYGWDAEGYGRLIAVPATSGSQNAGGVVIEYDSPPQSTPEWAVRLMCVTLGAYLRQNKSFGIKWRVYAG